MSTDFKQFNEEGDNIAGDKNINIGYDNRSTVLDKIHERIEMNKGLEVIASKIEQKPVRDAIRSLIKDNIREQQVKAHNLVPIGLIRGLFSHYVSKEHFRSLIEELETTGEVVIDNSDFCRVPAIDNKYKLR